MFINKAFLSSLIMAALTASSGGSNAPVFSRELLSSHVQQAFRKLHQRESHQRESHQQPRKLNVAQCEEDIDDFHADNRDLGEALENYDDEYDEAEEACDDDASVCTINEDRFPSTPLYIAACKKADGEMWETDYIVQCTATVDGETSSFSHIFLNEDLCVPKDSTACDPKDIQSSVQEDVNDALDLLEAVVAIQSEDSLECAFGMTVTDPAGVTSRSGQLQVPSASPAHKSFVVGALLMAIAVFV